MPHELRFEELKKAECLIGEIDSQPNMVLLLQTENDLYAVPLHNESVASTGLQSGPKSEAVSIFASLEDNMV